MYPDNPDPTLARLRDGLFRLFEAKRFDEAAATRARLRSGSGAKKTKR